MAYLGPLRTSLRDPVTFPTYDECVRQNNNSRSDNNGADATRLVVDNTGEPWALRHRCLLGQIERVSPVQAALIVRDKAGKLFTVLYRKAPVDKQNATKHIPSCRPMPGCAIAILYPEPLALTPPREPTPRIPGIVLRTTATTQVRRQSSVV